MPKAREKSKNIDPESSSAREMNSEREESGGGSSSSIDNAHVVSECDVQLEPLKDTSMDCDIQLEPLKDNSMDCDVQLEPLKDTSMDSNQITVLEHSPSRDTLNTTTSSIGGKNITMVGTLRRGHKSSEIIHVTMSEDNLRALTHEDTPEDCVWGFDKGIHIVLFSFICVPVAFIASFVVAGYLGTITWYNIFVHFYDDKGFGYRILLCPVLIIFYPPVIVILTLAIALYAAVIQISWFLTSWKRDFKDFEKGFYGWLCSKLGLEDYCAYDVVEVTGETATSDSENVHQLEAQTSFMDNADY
ncbi:transmembrane protein 169-like [Glandiceps talaboti]